MHASPMKDVADAERRMDEAAAGCDAARRRLEELLERRRWWWRPVYALGFVSGLALGLTLAPAMVFILLARMLP